ncbi:hypothetical protein F4823DRAFT_150881 [Ustulina deusta]|nr:hypothetical protein F4823DRAFT_150881 [Ustulina deusta]
MACPSSILARGQHEGQPVGPAYPATPRRYSHLMTYSPAGYRDLPAELRLMIWETTIDHTPVFWDMGNYVAIFDIQKRIAFITRHFANRVWPSVTLSQLNQESRHFVFSRFRCLTPGDVDKLFGSFYEWRVNEILLRDRTTSPRGPMQYTINFKVDVFSLNRYVWTEGNRWGAKFPPMAEVQNAAIRLRFLEPFLDGLRQGVFDFRGLKKIYAEGYPEDYELISLYLPPDIPPLQPASSEDHIKLALKITGWECSKLDEIPRLYDDCYYDRIASVYILTRSTAPRG